MKIILTGGTGFIGSRLIELISKIKSYETLIISRKKIKINDKSNIRNFKCDLNSLKKLKNKIKVFNPDVLIHLAWDKIPNFNKTNCKTNEKNSKNLINFIIKNTSTKHIIVSGSCFEIYPPDKSYKYFVESKKNILRFLKIKTKVKKIKYTWLRIFYVYGSNQRKGSIIPYLLNCIKQKKVSNINEPNKRHDFIYIDDVCNAIINTIKHSKKSNIIEIGSGKVSSIKKIAKLIKKISNNKLRYNLNLSSIKNNVFKAKIQKAKKEILWKPKINLENGLKKILRLY